MKPILFSILMLTGCHGFYIKRLENAEFDHYSALKVFMDKNQINLYLKKKTRDQRDAYLKELGLWDRFYQYEPNIRDKIVQRDVQVGWNTDMLQMSWGRPIDKRKEFRDSAEQSYNWIYKFERHAKGSEVCGKESTQPCTIVWLPGSPTEYKAISMFKRHVVIEEQGRRDLTTDDIIVEMIDKK